MTPAARRGLTLTIGAFLAFAVQDGLSRLLAETYNTPMVVMVRYWVFAGFVMLLALRRPEGPRRAVSSSRLWVHVLRAALLVSEILLIIQGYTLIGLVESQAIFAVCPLLIVALSGPLLGERIGLARWIAVGIGLAGVLIILRPGGAVFTAAALLPLGAACLFALYSVLTRLACRDEPMFPAFFWPAVIGALMASALGVPNWEPIAQGDLPVLSLYIALSILAQWLLLKAYQVMEASRVQPFAYLHILAASVIGIVAFDDALTPQVMVGAVLVIAAGLYAFWQESRHPAGVSPAIPPSG
jgi:drug/metabolite transporter (DMT)-like permease